MYESMHVHMPYVCGQALSCMLHSLSCPQFTAPDTDLQPPPLKKQAYNVSCSLFMIIPINECSLCTVHKCFAFPSLFEENIV